MLNELLFLKKWWACYISTRVIRLFLICLSRHDDDDDDDDQFHEAPRVVKVLVN